MVFEYTLVNGNGTRHTLITDKFFEPGQYVHHLGEVCYVEDLAVGTSVSCAEIHEQSALDSMMIIC